MTTPSQGSTGLPRSWEISLDRVTDPAELQSEWLDLEARSAGSYFQSWGWIGCWMQALPSEMLPRRLRIRHEGRLVGLGLLGADKTVRRRVIRSRVLFVSETGRPAYDTLTVEHNGLLVETGLDSPVIRESASWLVDSVPGWDEIRISGLDKSRLDVYLEAAVSAGLTGFVEWEKPTYSIDLDAVRSSGGDLLATLSRNSRYQLRRAIRGYEQQGAVRLRFAESVDETLDFFEKLRELHQRYWNAKGQPGAFASRFALAFHDCLIRSRFPHGEIQLAEVRTGDKILGYLYNFVRDRVVSNYQSGFLYEDDPKAKPGLVSHYKAAQHNLAQGMRCYDFLMGHQRYKKSLATTEESMVWLVLQRRRLRFRVENRLRRIRNLLYSSD